MHTHPKNDNCISSFMTTKKFDAIVEKAGKVDANYAAQIEGYCSLFGEYGKKFEAVCAMLQPEKLRLSQDKYREKLEGINTGYQNAKDTHEQEQSAYEAELYEIETVWHKKMLDKAEDYLIRSAECIVLGNFTDEVTLLGVGVQIVLGILDLDLPCDIRDIIADIKNLAETDRVRWDLIGMLALDLIGLIPVIGVLKYSDETAESVASGEKILKESQTIYESFADMMSLEDAKRYLDFLENGSREGLTSAELAGVEKADALLVSRKVEYEDVWDLRNVGDALESGKTSNGLPDWLKARFEAGNSFNKENRPRYPYNEVEVYGDGKNYVVDSYIPGSEIVSRKFTQLASVKESTGIGYLNELQKKYPSGAIITDSPFNPKVLRGKTMTGNLNLEIPEQKGPIPQSVIDYANNKGIIIRDVNGKEYN